MAGTQALSWEFILQKAGGSSAGPSVLWEVPREQNKAGWDTGINGDTPVAGAAEGKRQRGGWILVNLGNLLPPEIYRVWGR